jgi:hypothetical protein
MNGEMKMNGGLHVHLSLSLAQRVRKWGKDEQIHLSALKDSFLEFDILEVIAGFQRSISNLMFDQSGRIVNVSFWLKTGGVYISLTLRIVQTGAAILDSP